MRKNTEYNEQDIITITPVESVRKRPGMYFRSRNETVMLIKKTVISEGYQCHTVVNKDDGEILIESDGYKYTATRKLLNNKCANNLVNDLISLYTGGSSDIGRCLIGYGFILNAVSIKFIVHAWDGVEHHDIQFHNGVQSQEIVNGVNYNGLRVQASIHHDFIHLI